MNGDSQKKSAKEMAPSPQAKMKLEVKWKKRVDFVYKLLLDKYGISADYLVKKTKDDNSNRFHEAVLNQVVIIE